MSPSKIAPLADDRVIVFMGIEASRYTTDVVVFHLKCAGYLHGEHQKHVTDLKTKLVFRRHEGKVMLQLNGGSNHFEATLESFFGELSDIFADLWITRGRPQIYCDSGVTAALVQLYTASRPVAYRRVLPSDVTSGKCIFHEMEFCRRRAALSKWMRDGGAFVRPAALQWKTHQRGGVVNLIMPMMDVFKSYLPRSTADLSFGGYDTGFFPRSPMETAKLMVGCWRYLHDIVPTIPAPMLQDQILKNLAQKNGDDLQSACLALVSKLCSLLTKKRESFRCQFTIGEETLTLKFPDVPEVEQRDAAQSGSVEKVDCASQTSEDSEEADCSPQDVGGLQGAQGHPAGFGFPTPPWGAYGPMWAPYMYTAPMIPMYMGGLGVNTQGCSCSCGKAAGVGTQKGCTK